MNTDLQLQRVGTGLSIDYTPGSAVTAGTPTQLAGLVGVPANDIAASVQGAIDIAGLYEGLQKALVITRGDVVGWDSNGTPVTGTALSGAITNVVADMNFILGTCTKTSAAADSEVEFVLNVVAAQATVAQLTDNSGGAASDTIASISDTATKNAVASIVAKLNAIQVDLEAAQIRLLE